MRRLVIFLVIINLLLNSLAPLITFAQEPERPKSKHLPQITIDAPGGTKINTWNGNLFYGHSLISIPGRGMPISLSASYNSSWFNTKINYGFGWQFSYNIYYIKKDNDVIVTWEDGRSEKFVYVNGSYLIPADTNSVLTQYETGKFKVRTKFGVEYFFENETHKKITKIIDSNNNSLSFAYNAENLVNSITNSSGKKVDLAYSSGKLTSITDSNITPARSITITYNGEQLISISNLKGDLTLFEYNSENFLTKITDSRGYYTNLNYVNGIIASAIHVSGSALYMSYDTVNLITTAIYPSGENVNYITKYFYDSLGRVKKIDKVKDLAGNAVSSEYVWDSNNNLLEYKDENGNITYYTYDSKGNIITITDPLNNITTYTYEATFNKVASITDAGSKTTTYEYDTKGNLTKITDPLNKVTTFSYNDQGELVTTTNAKNKASSFEYTNGLLTKSIDPLSNSSTTTYDGAGRVVTSTDPNLNTITYEYDALDLKTKVIDPLNNAISYLYDKQGNLLKQTDPKLNTVTYEYDSMGRVTKEIDANNNFTSYIYNKLGNLTSIIDPKSGTTSFEYDYLGKLIKETDPNGKITTYSYDNVGNMVSRTDPNGSTTTYTYDKLNRVKTINYPGENDSYFDYDARGNVILEKNLNVEVSKTYDELNRIKSIQTITNGITKVVSYEYDEVGNRSAMIDPDNGRTNYTYDDANRLKTITNPKGDTITYSYDAGSRVTLKEYSNGTKVSYSYDKSNRLSEVKNEKGTELISSFAYEYDVAGNRTKMTRNGTEVSSYDYDKLYQLTLVTNPDSSTEAYEYDALGNRTKLTTGGVTTTYSYNAGNQLTAGGGKTYEWNNNGNLTKKTEGTSSTTYTYDPADQLTKVTYPDTKFTSYTYYPDGKRLSTTDKDGNTKYFFYDGANDLIETDSAGTTQVRYTTGTIDGWHVANMNNASYFYYADGLNSVVNMTNSTGGVVKTYKYGSFGNITSDVGNVYNPHTYTGRRIDTESGLYQYRARYYDAGSGRFTQKDPAKDGKNFYSYVGNNPLNLIDPSGLYAQYPTTIKDYLKQSNTYRELRNGFEVAVGFIDAISSNLIADNISRILEEKTNKKFNVNEDSKFYSSTYKGSSVYYTLRYLWLSIINNSTTIPTDVNEHKGISETYEIIRDEGPVILKSLFSGIKSIFNIFKDFGEYRKEVEVMQMGSYVYIKANFKGSRNGSYIKLGDVNGALVAYYPTSTSTGGAPSGGTSSSGSSWKISYFIDKNLNHFHSYETETSEFLHRGWGDGKAGPVGPDQFGVRFEKEIYLSHKADWRFKVRSDDGIRIYLDGQIIEDKWWNGGHDVGPVRYVEEGYHDLRVDYFDDTGNAYIDISWERYFPNGVTLCRSTGYNGGCSTFTSNVPSLGASGFGNDEAESIKVSDGWQAVLFVDDNYSGQFSEYSGDLDNLDNTGVRDGKVVKNNQASSILVRRTKPENFQLFSMGDYGGDKFTGDSTITNLEYWYFNDKAKSAKIRAGYEAIICTDSNFHGNCGRGSGDFGDINSLGQGLKTSEQTGQASSVRICENKCPAWPANPTPLVPGNGTQYVTGSTINFYWFGVADEFDIELYGGGLSSPRRRGFSQSSQWSLGDLPASANAYHWRLKAWNQYGEIAWVNAGNFMISDVALIDAKITGDATVNLNTDAVYRAEPVPINSTAPITYNWSPAPKSGQGTNTATYNWNSAGDKQVSVTINAATGSKTGTYNLKVVCIDKYLAEYFDNKTLEGSAALSRCEDSVQHDWGEDGPLNSDNNLNIKLYDYIGTGNDGDLTIASGQTVEFNKMAAITTNSTVGLNTLSVNSTANLSVGDEVLVIQMRGVGAGSYEYNKITAINSTTAITLEKGLTYAYTYSTDSGAQVVKIPNYNNLTIDGTLTSTKWNGSVGGVLTFKVKGKLIVNGLITMTGRGFMGGPGHSTNNYGYTGEGAPGTHKIQNDPNGNGGGGATQAKEGGPGGAGGGYGSSGVSGDLGSKQDLTRAIGGNPAGNETLASLLMGGGGGGGGRAYSNPGGKGGDGGGIILINAETIEGTGQVLSNGANGNSGIYANYSPENQYGYSGGGGGGAGGAILLRAKTIGLTSNVAAFYGQGGASGGGGSARGREGGYGRIRVEYCQSYSGNYSNMLSKERIYCPKDNFSAKWSKDVNLTSGVYKFDATSDDGIRVWLDNVLIIDKWVGGSQIASIEKEIQEGVHSIRVEYFEDTGSANVNFNYSRVGDIPVPGYSVEYFNNETLTGDPVFTTTEDTINHNWNDKPNEATNADHFSVRWIGNFNFANSGDYTFIAQADDGIKVWVDGVNVIDGWFYQSTTEYRGKINLSTGMHEIKVEYFEGGGSAVVKLWWEEGDKVIVSEPCVSGENNIYCAQYFNGTNFGTTPTNSRKETIIENEWGNGSPIANVTADLFTARWDGKFDFAGGRYKFTSFADDGIRAWIDNVQVLDRWSGGYSHQDFEIDITQGLHDVKVEFIEHYGGASVVFKWLKISELPLPTTCLNIFCAEYYNNLDFSGTPALTREETEINHILHELSPGAGVNADNFTARWIGNFDLPAGTYEFTTLSDDGVRLWVDGNPVINNWTDHGMTEDKGTVTLSSGNHNIKMEFYERGGGAIAKLSWLKLQDGNTSTNQCTNTYCFEYFNNITLSGTPVYTGQENIVDHSWGTGGPGNGVSDDYFSARWTGNIYFTSGSKTFTTLSDDGIRLWVDGNLVIDNWTDHGATYNGTTLNLAEGYHEIKLEYYEKLVDAVIQLNIT